MFFLIPCLPFGATGLGHQASRRDGVRTSGRSGIPLSTLSKRDTADDAVPTRFFHRVRDGPGKYFLKLIRIHIVIPKKILIALAICGITESKSKECSFIKNKINTLYCDYE